MSKNAGRDAEIVRLVSEGAAYVEVAKRFGITPPRVASICKEQDRIKREEELATQLQDWRDIPVTASGRFVDPSSNEIDWVSSRIKNCLLSDGFETMGEVADYMVANPDWPLKASRSVPNDPSGVPNFSKKSYEALLSWFRKRGLPISNLTIERENSHLKAKLNVLISIHGIDAVRNCVERASIDKEDRI